MTTFQIAAAGWARSVKKVDRVWLVIALLFTVLVALAPDQAWSSGRFVVDALLGILPFLLLAVGFAAYAKASGADGLIARAFQGQIALMVLFAALVGAFSPFCSCGVIPLIAAMLSMGVPLPAVMAFWLSSPLMDPSMFMLTVGTLGVEFAIAKTAAAIGLGAMGGYGILLLSRTPAFANPLREGIGDGGCAGGKIRGPKPVVWAFWREDPRRAAFTGEALSSTLFLGKWLTLAFVLESLMLAYIPADFIGSMAGDGGPLSIVIAALVGVPAYLNGYAALPLVAGLIHNGMAPGAGMAFLIAGGVTSLPAAIAVFALARRPVFLAYLAFALIGSILAGLIYGAIA